MKRSEMVKRMTEHWLGLFPEEPYINDPEIQKEVEEKMSNLLSLLEYRGMKPPVRKRCPVLLTDTHVWEVENEQN